MGGPFRQRVGSSYDKASYYESEWILPSTISVTGLPPGGTYNLSTSTVAVNGYANLQLTLPAGLAAGPYPVTVTATSGSLTHSLAITLTVSATGGLPAPWAADDIGPMRFT